MASTKFDRDNDFIGTEAELATLVGPHPRDLACERNNRFVMVHNGATFEQRMAYLEKAIVLKHGHPPYPPTQPGDPTEADE